MSRVDLPQLSYVCVGNMYKYITLNLFPFQFEHRASQIYRRVEPSGQCGLAGEIGALTLEQDCDGW